MVTSASNVISVATLLIFLIESIDYRDWDVGDFSTFALHRFLRKVYDFESIFLHILTSTQSIPFFQMSIMSGAPFTEPPPGARERSGWKGRNGACSRKLSWSMRSRLEALRCLGGLEQDDEDVWGIFGVICISMALQSAEFRPSL